jgi:excisionase family DNA binding protein
MEILGVGRVTLYRWMNEGKLRHIYVGSRRRFTKEELDRFVREGTEEMKSREKNETPGLGVSRTASAVPA